MVLIDVARGRPLAAFGLRSKSYSGRGTSRNLAQRLVRHGFPVPALDRWEWGSKILALVHSPTDRDAGLNGLLNGEHCPLPRQPDPTAMGFPEREKKSEFQREGRSEIR